MTQFLFPFFFFNDTATTEIYTLSLHDALPILKASPRLEDMWQLHYAEKRAPNNTVREPGERSEEHTSELQSRLHLVCRLLLEKKKNHNAIPGDDSVDRARYGDRRAPPRTGDS